MKNFLLVCFIYLFFIQNIFALEFVKSTENPLKVNYINGYTNHLQADIFKEANIYKGIFVINKPPETYFSLGYFESDNGIEWQMRKEILNTGTDLSNPSVTKTQAGYQLFITRYDNNSIYKIYSTSCDLNFNCLSSLSPVIMPDTSNYSERYGVFAGRPFQQDSRTYIFFGAWGDDGFKLKLAYSDDLFNWQRCRNDKSFLYGGDGPFPYSENNDLYLLFHKSDSSGLKVAKSTLPLTCDSIFEDQGYLLQRNESYDLNHQIFPSIVNDRENLKLFYSGLGNDNKWRLNLACEEKIYLFPTSTPIIKSENPTPTESIPIVILPGTFASWNRDAILHNKEVTYKDWKLQRFVMEYNGLINTLINLGYEINKNIFLFPFDWRQEIEKSANNLDYFLNEKIWINNPTKKINIVGHSLGGLIGRIFTQKNKDKINQIITVGSPHQGVVQVYKPLESGEIDRDNTFFWLALKTILILNKTAIENDRTTVSSKFPVAKDLFPTFNFLKDISGNEISINSLAIKNSLLSSYNQNLSDIFPFFTAIYGEDGKNTPAGFIVEPQSSLEKILGCYSDGKPKNSYFDLGDYTVLSRSANQDSDAEKLNLDHGGLIYKKDGIKKILDILKIKYEESQIVEGKGTRIDSSLIFLIKSPATMEVEFNNNIYGEEDGIIFIPEAQSGNYNLKVKGTDKGKYEVIVGQISENNDLWESINGETDVFQIDDYYIPYNNKTAVSIFQMTIMPTSTAIPTPTEQIYLSSTLTLIPTFVIQPTNSPEEILGEFSQKKKLVTPTIKVVKKLKTINQIEKSINIENCFWLSIVTSILVQFVWFIRKKSARR